MQMYVLHRHYGEAAGTSHQHKREDDMMLDQYNRKIDYMRISVTDKCNFRCTYCMPKEGIKTLQHEELLHFEEIERIVRSAVELGVRRIKITGGEPLVRRGVIRLISSIHKIPGIEEITLTTNGYRLSEYLPDLLEAGVTGINISLDTLNRERFQQITGSDALEKVLQSIEDTLKSGISNVKINCVLMNINREDWSEVAGLARRYPIHVRFIEMMPIGKGTSYLGVTQNQIKKRLEAAYGNLTPCSERLGNGPAEYYQAEGFRGRIGFISAMSHEFCDSCNRFRLTIDGYVKLCLNCESKINLRDFMRQGVSDQELTDFLQQAIYHKPRCHGFENQDKSDKEVRQMASIGG